MHTSLSLSLLPFLFFLFISLSLLPSLSLPLQIKVVNSITKVCTTLAGTGSPGLVDGPFEIAQFSEPGGLSLGRGGSVLYVADTNNHCIRVMDLKERTVSQVIMSE